MEGRKQSDLHTGRRGEMPFIRRRRIDQQAVDNSIKRPRGNNRIYPQLCGLFFSTESFQCVSGETVALMNYTASRVSSLVIINRQKMRGEKQ